MSFAKDTKKQILNSPLENAECELAFFGGILHASGEFDLAKKSVSFLTDIKELFDFTNKIFVRLYGQELKIETEKALKVNGVIYYRISFPSNNIFSMLQDFGLADNQGNFYLHKIDNGILKENATKKSFLKGVFIACATSSIKLSQNTEPTTTGYNIEFVSHSHDFLMEVSNLLTDFDIIPKLVARKNHYVLYIKESGQICDLLALVEAYDSVLKLQNELALRELRNKVNRQTNCLSANITKTVNASYMQVEAIKLISSTIGLESLPFELQEVALLRLANPEESLSELLKLSSTKLTKSGLNHRIKKLLAIAKELS